MSNITCLLSHSAYRFPQKTALITDEKQFTYCQLDQLIKNLAANLQHQLNIRPSDRIAMVMTNSWEFVVTYLSILRVGAIAIPVNSLLQGSELRFILEDVNCHAAFVTKDCWPVFKTAVVGLHTLTKIVGVRFEAKETISFGPLVSEPSVPMCEQKVDPHDIAAILYTSGTTGMPKGAMITHDNILFNTYSCERCFNFKHNEVHLAATPLYAVTGLNTILQTSIRLGSTLVLMRFTTVQDLWKTIQTHRVNTFLGVPSMFTMMTTAKGLERFDLSTIHTFGYAGAPMPADTISRLANIFPHINLQNFYGLTETTSITTVLPPGDALKFPASVGKTVPELDLMIANAEGTPMPSGAVGELCVHGRSVFKGYLNQSNATSESFFNEWFRTGDLARFNEDGYVFLMGRKKELIIVAGENVYAAEVENVLGTHPKVLEAAVIGVENPVLGEVVKAFVVSRPGEVIPKFELKRFCKNKLASFKVPQIVEFRNDLPRNSTGKIIKSKLA